MFKDLFFIYIIFVESTVKQKLNYIIKKKKKSISEYRKYMKKTPLHPNG